MLLEIFVKFERHRGTYYKAASWILVEGDDWPGPEVSDYKQLIPHQRYLAGSAAPRLRSRAVPIGNGYGFTEVCTAETRFSIYLTET